MNIASSWTGPRVTGPDHPLTASVSEAVGYLADRPQSSTIEVMVHLGSLSELQELNRSLVREGRSCLIVREEFGTAFIGPWVLPGRLGCHACFLARKVASFQRDSVRLDIHRQLEENQISMVSGWSFGPSRQFVAALVAKDVETQLAGEDPQALEAVLTVRLDTLETKCRSFLKESHCDVCGHSVDDRREAAMLDLRPVLKPHPNHYRGSALGPQLELMERTYVDADHGLVSGWWRQPIADEGILSAITAPLSASIGWHPVAGHGRATTRDTAKVIAICEALERFGGMRPWSRRTQVRGSFAQVVADAIDPRSFGLPSGAANTVQGGLVPYVDELVMSWVWAYSFKLKRPVLVPEQIAYYDHITAPSEQFINETSNGCALGGTLEEAILHGILEVAERDAFLVTWHARLPSKKINLATIEDLETFLIIERYQRMHGFRVEAFDITMPERIPCFWVMGVEESGDPTKPRVMCSAGASLDPEKALKSALSELAHMTTSLCRQYEQESERERARRMLSCPADVVTIEDHRLVNAIPEAWPRFKFLGDQPKPLQNLFRRTDDEPPEMNLTKDLENVVERYVAQGLDVIVVNQTCPEHQRTGLHCVKVLIPGTLPMTFGHINRRLAIDRVRAVPFQLGYSSQPLSDEEIRCDPHPFP